MVRQCPSPEASEIDTTALGSADRESDKNKNTSRVTSVREEKRQLRAQETQGQMFNPTF
jgi:hypothetical protein